jgi:predicted CopG family antitoxin
VYIVILKELRKMITILISRKLHEKLKEIKLHPRESFNDVIQKLYDERIDK